MQLIEVQLRNWRSYRNITFSFPRLENKQKKVVLIGAQNGVGKTSLLIALYLGLFGREAMHLIEGIRVSGVNDEINTTYRNLLEHTIHRPALKNNDPIVWVRLKFESASGDSIIIKRMWAFRAGGKVRDLNSPDGEEVLIEVNSEPRQYSAWQEANARIAELLFPHSVMPCFFFDGEQAQERVEAAGGRALLQAVKTLYGTDLLSELRDSLKNYYEREKSTLKKDLGDIREDELTNKREEFESRKVELENIAISLNDKRRTISTLNSEYQKLTNEILQLVGDSQTDITHYSDSIRALSSEQDTLKKRLALGVAAASLPLALSRRAKKTEMVLSAEHTRDKWLHLRNAAQGKAQLIVEQVFPREKEYEIIPPLNSSQEIALRGRLEKALEALWSPPPVGCAEEYRFNFLQEADRISVLSKIHRITKQQIPNLQETASEWSKVSVLLKEAQRKYEAIRDIEPKLQEIKLSMDSTREQILLETTEENSLENKEKSLTHAIKDLRAAIGQMEKRQSKADPVRQKIDLVYKIMEVIYESNEKLVPLCKEALEDRCTYHFSHMISEEFKNFRVRFDADTEPTLETDNQLVYVTSLSGAQKRVFGLAFTLAVADVSRQIAPIIIDTPVGNMDSIYRLRVLEHVAQCAPGQVIILSHDEEISREYKKMLDPYISKSMLLSFKQISDGCGETSIVEDKYFGDE